MKYHNVNLCLILLLIVGITGACGPAKKKCKKTVRYANTSSSFFLTSEPASMPASRTVIAPADLPDMAHNLEPRFYESCEAIEQDFHSLLAQKQHNDHLMMDCRLPYDDGSDYSNNDDDECEANDSTTFDQKKSSASAPSTDYMTSMEAPTEARGIATAPASTSEQITNLQEAGVDEADILKLGKHSIFVVRGQNIHVTDRSSLTYLGAIDLPAAGRGLTLYADAERLVTLTREQRQIATCSSGVQARHHYVTAGAQAQQATAAVVTSCSDASKLVSVVRVYKEVAQSLPVLEGEQMIDGAFTESRLVNGRLVVVLPAALPFNVDAQLLSHGSLAGKELTPQPLPIVGKQINGVDCTRIARPSVLDFDTRMTIVASLDIRNITAPTKSMAVLGGGDHVYMTDKSLYVAKHGLRWQPWLGNAATTLASGAEAIVANLQEMADKLVISKIDFDSTTGEVTFAAMGSVAGQAKDQWAFKEYQGANALMVATTTNEALISNEQSGRHNHLWVLTQEGHQLRVAAAINDFAPREDIRSIRYVGTKAYVVTFRQTDPLFAFDLRDPLSPQLLGELKTPGFSTYLHPIGDELMLGLGFAADELTAGAPLAGIHLSLFDIKDPLKMARIDHHSLGGEGSFSDATADHKAFFFDPQQNIVGVPVVSAQAGRGALFSGAVLYKVEAGKLNFLTRLSHADLISKECQVNVKPAMDWRAKHYSLDINRLALIDGRLLSISRFAIRHHAGDELEELRSTTRFGGGDDVTCAESVNAE